MDEHVAISEAEPELAVGSMAEDGAGAELQRREAEPSAIDFDTYILGGYGQSRELDADAAAAASAAVVAAAAAQASPPAYPDAQGSSSFQPHPAHPHLGAAAAALSNGEIPRIEAPEGDGGVDAAAAAVDDGEARESPSSGKAASRSLQPADANRTTTPYARTPELRVSHKLAERKRRREIKDMFEDLREALPEQKGPKTSKWEILSKTIEFMHAMRDDIQLLRQENDLLRSEVERCGGTLPEPPVAAEAEPQQAEDHGAMEADQSMADDEHLQHQHELHQHEEQQEPHQVEQLEDDQSMLAPPQEQEGGHVDDGMQQQPLSEEEQAAHAQQHDAAAYFATAAEQHADDGQQHDSEQLLEEHHHQHLAGDEAALQPEHLEALGSHALHAADAAEQYDEQQLEQYQEAGLGDMQAPHDADAQHADLEAPEHAAPHDAQQQPQQQAGDLLLDDVDVYMPQ